MEVLVLPDLASLALRRRSIGPARLWGSLSVLLVALTSAVLWATRAAGWLYLAFSLAALGFFFCTWGAVAGIKLLVRRFADIEQVLEAPQTSIHKEVGETVRAWTLGRRPLLCGMLFGAVITTCLWLQGHEQPRSAFAEPFALSHGALYVPVFVTAFAIGVGHSCIVGALRVARCLRRYPARSMYSTFRIRRISVTYLWLAGLCSATYLSFLGYVVCMVMSGVDLSLSVDLLVAGVGSVVLWVLFYPQWVIHRILRENRVRLTARALRRVEELGPNDAVGLSSDQWREILQAVECVEAMSRLPVVGFRWREVSSVVMSYVVPMVTFLSSQLAKLT